ncbi:hypothetical protein D7Y13_33340 [Corallococcus praedator]|uniref:DUF4340 domain-containing protein n=1 Tax=Corallococcus praedator TaxID=2316724 RepID=A0ABX9QAS8_9BACT|nr:MULTISPECIES: hypothetical protein [Corallococcus]RKH21942.1 hypothetical protein D7X75_36450 [Corallococcus sp. CA031C]RKH94463.1 hypothetical protein D7Y13_33340 [Corallococcus praedator]
MKKVILALVIVLVGLGVAGAFLYRNASPSAADHRLLTVASGDETVASVVVNLRLLKSVRSVESWKERIDPAEKYLLKVGNLPPRHRDLLLETFSSFASGFVKTAEGPSPFRLFASHGSADQALEALKKGHLVEATTGDDYILIDPETCGREGPFRLLKGDKLLAFVPAALATDFTARLAQEPGRKMESLLIAQGGINLQPFLESLAPPFVQMALGREEIVENARRLSLTLRADTDGGIWAELDVFGDHPDQIQKLWEKATGADSPLKTVAETSVKVTPSKDAFRLTFDVNALQKHADVLTRSFSSFQNEALKDEDLKTLDDAEEALLDPKDLYAYDEALTPASFFERSGEDCSPSHGVALDDAKKLRLAFNSLSARENQPEVDFVSLTSSVCLPPHYAPVLAKRAWMEVRVQQPELDRPTCGPLADEANGMTSEEDFSREQSNDMQVATNKVGFAFKRGVDTQKLPAIEGSVTVQVPTRVKKVTLAFGPPYGRTELAFTEGKLTVEATRVSDDGLTFQLGSEGTPPAVLAVRALNAAGKYLETESRSGFSASMTLPFVGRLESNDSSILAHGKPAQLEFVLVDATTPYVRPFKLTPPFPQAEDEEEGDTEPEPAAAPLSQAVFEQTLQSAESIAQREERYTRYANGGLLAAPGVPGAAPSPFKVLLQTQGVFENNLEIVWTDEVRQHFGQLDTGIQLEVLEADFVDGTRLRPENMKETRESESGAKEYVWGSRFGDPREWSTAVSLGRPNISAGDIRGVIFSDFLPHRMEDVPIARIRGQLSFSLPETIAVSALTPVSLHTRATLGEARFHVNAIEGDEVGILSENTDQPGFSAVFADAKGNPIRASLKKRTDFDDATFRLDFETQGAARQWQMLRAQGANKTYTYPFEITAHELKPVSSRKRK